LIQIFESPYVHDIVRLDVCEIVDLPDFFRSVSEKGGIGPTPLHFGYSPRFGTCGRLGNPRRPKTYSSDRAIQSLAVGFPREWVKLIRYRWIGCGSPRGIAEGTFV